MRHNILCSILTQRPIRITDVGTQATPHRLDEAAVDFLKIIDAMTKGSEIQLSEDGHELLFAPGAILGGELTFQLTSTRCVTYLAEPLAVLLTFAKLDSEITLKGCTHSLLDISADTMRLVTCRLIGMFGGEVSLRVVQRGAPPEGGGCVVLCVKAKRKLQGVQLSEPFRAWRIRGVAYSVQTSNDFPHRSIAAAKGLLLKFLPDVYIAMVSGHHRRSEKVSGGYGMMLVAEAKSKRNFLSQETVGWQSESPEEVGYRVAGLLLDEIVLGGCVDRPHHLLVLLLAALAPMESSTLRIGSLSADALSAMALMETFFGVTCMVQEEERNDQLPDTFVISCVGSGLLNMWKNSG